MPKQSRIKNNADSISLGFALFLSGVPGGRDALSRQHSMLSVAKAVKQAMLANGRGERQRTVNPRPSANLLFALVLIMFSATDSQTVVNVLIGRRCLRLAALQMEALAEGEVG